MRCRLESRSTTSWTNLPEEKRYTVYAAPMEAQPTGAALVVVSDVTRIRRLEQLRSEFVSNVTHELKTPLTSIRGVSSFSKAQTAMRKRAGIFTMYWTLKPNV